MPFDVLIRHARIATMTGPDLGEIDDGAMGVCDGLIQWIGDDANLPSNTSAKVEIDAAGAWILPGLIDCHTHAVYAGSRAPEFEQRLAGASYEEVARSGGGILSTVRATRAATAEDLLSSAVDRIEEMTSQGVTTVEIKSGYGLDRETELKMLRVAREVGVQTGITVVATYVGAHTVPPEFDADEYIDMICRDMLPTIAQQSLADAVDAFCETIAFTPAQVRRVFDTARTLGLPVKLHADQLSDSGGAALAAEFGALSADHVEYTSAAGVQAMATAGTCAVLLPGAFYTLHETQVPPIQAFRDHGVPMAVATDCNPGTSPCTSLLLMLNMACTLFRLTPSEALRGATICAARALGLQDRKGQLAVGFDSDFGIWPIDHPRELCYSIGTAARPIVSYAGAQSVSL